MRLPILLPLAALALSFSGCTPTKGYSGPVRPDTEISIIKTAAEGGVSLSSENISGFDMGIAGISVLPGSQEFSAQATLEGEIFDCRPYTEFNSSGFYECEDERRRKNKYNNCDCFDYLSVHENCQQVLKEGLCRASFNTLPGERYEIRVGVRFGAPAIGVLLENSGREIAKGSCEKTDERTTSIDRYVGSGRWEANRAGFYSCRGY